MTKFLIIIGSYVAAVLLASKAIDVMRLGRLPGDFVINRKRGKRPIHIPLATTMLLSFAISLLYWLSAKIG